jgi:putative NIF3 family GTP cyclohydrolase 1 type 2
MGSRGWGPANNRKKMTAVHILSRRQFVSAAAALVPIALPSAQNKPITVQDLVDRIRATVGVPWRDKTVDGLKAGAASDTVAGIATTVSATFDVLKRAAAAGHNFVVTQEPAFYGANDEVGNRADDPVYLAKKAFIGEHRLAIFRFSDHWRAHQRDEGAGALAEALSWTRRRGAGGFGSYDIPETTFGQLVAHVKDRLQIRGGVRTVGRNDMRVRTVFVAPGTTDLLSVVARLPDVDVVLAGEPREWEAVPYVLDARAAAQPKAMIAVGRLVSEEPGMRACAGWIRGLAPEIRVEHYPVGDPYWSPRS